MLIIRLCPIFMVSNVSGHNLPTLRTFLNCLPSSQSDEKYVVDAPFEFQISDVFSVPFVGTVVSGVITSGAVHGEFLKRQILRSQSSYSQPMILSSLDRTQSVNSCLPQ